MTNKRDEIEILLRRLTSSLRTSQGWLNGWKEVAQYMSVSARTAKNWERKFSLPIRRGPSSRVKAIPYELDRWMINFDDMRKKVWAQMKRKEENGTGQTVATDWRGGKHEGPSRNLGAVSLSRFGPAVLSNTIKELVRGQEDEEPMGSRD